MLTEAQQDRIVREAYLPEHLPGYVGAISGVEPLCFGDYLAYAGPDVLIFIGYPLGGDAGVNTLEGVLAEAVRLCSKAQVSLIAPAIPPSLGQVPPPSDHYYRLELTAAAPSPKTRNMLRRAAREVTVETGRAFGPEHQGIVASFIADRTLDGGTRFIYDRIDRYLAAAPGARLLEARNSAGKLIAFDVADFTARDYGFYMFNFTDPGRRYPGVSDLLLAQMIEAALQAGKRYLNLGLGINAGIVAFKRKWGGVPFLPHAAHRYRPRGRGFLAMLIEGLTGR